jgi:hypothetical protein
MKWLSNHFMPDIISIDKLPNTFELHAVRSSFDSLTFSALIAVICNYNATLFSKPFHVITKVNIRILITLTETEYGHGLPMTQIVRLGSVRLGSVQVKSAWVSHELLTRVPIKTRTRGQAWVLLTMCFLTGRLLPSLSWLRCSVSW